MMDTCMICTRAQKNVICQCQSMSISIGGNSMRKRGKLAAAESREQATQCERIVRYFSPPSFATQGESRLLLLHRGKATQATQVALPKGVAPQALSPLVRKAMTVTHRASPASPIDAFSHHFLEARKHSYTTPSPV